MAAKNHGVKDLALFGYSHGGGSVRLLADEIVKLVNPADPRHDPDFAAKLQRVIWTGYIDAVEIAYDSRRFTGLQDPEETAPLLTPRHFNIFQDKAGFDPFAPTEPEGVQTQSNPGNATIDADFDVDHPPAGVPDQWPNEIYHWTKYNDDGQVEKEGIAENAAVQDLLWNSFISAVIAAG